MSNINVLPDIINLQQNLLNDIAQNNNINPNFDAISGQLDQFNQAVENANFNNKQILSDQTDVQQILSQEYQRLQGKKQNIDNALESKQRLSFLNDNYRQRYAEYLKIIVIFIITLVIVGCINFFGNVLSFIPDYILNFLVILIILIALISCYYIYMGILMRDNIYFNELNLSTPTNVTETGGQYVNTQHTGIFDYNYGTCVGSNCCDASKGLSYDDVAMVCTTATTGPTTGGTTGPTTGGTTGTTGPTGRTTATTGGTTATTRQGFTTMDLAYKNNLLKNINPSNNKISANTPFEFDEYAVYN